MIFDIDGGEGRSNAWGGRWGKSSNYGCCQSSGSLGVIIGHEKRSRGAHREEKVERKS